VASAYASASSPEILAHFDVCQTCLLDAVKVPAQSAGDPRRLTKACLAVAKVFSGGQHPGRGVGTSQAPLKLGGQSGEVSCLSISCQERVHQDLFDRSGCHSLAIDRIEGTGSIAQHDEILRMEREPVKLAQPIRSASKTGNGGQRLGLANGLIEQRGAEAST